MAYDNDVKYVRGQLIWRDNEKSHLRLKNDKYDLVATFPARFEEPVIKSTFCGKGGRPINSQNA